MYGPSLSTPPSPSEIVVSDILLSFSFLAMADDTKFMGKQRKIDYYRQNPKIQRESKIERFKIKNCHPRLRGYTVDDSYLLCAIFTL